MDSMMAVLTVIGVVVVAWLVGWVAVTLWRAFRRW